MRIYTYSVVAENKDTGDFYISESNIESKDTAYSLFDVLVAEGKYNHVRVDRTAVTVNALPNNKTEILVSDRWLDKHYNSEVTKGVIGYDSFSGLQSY
jgi:hypothetical protein